MSCNLKKAGYWNEKFERETKKKQKQIKIEGKQRTDKRKTREREI